MNRSIMRENCMIILYQIDMFEKNNIEYNKDEIVGNYFTHTNNFIDGILNGVLENKDSLNEVANKYMVDWTIDRIDKPGSEILRIALYELIYSDTPHVVAINEAVELAKKYSDDSVKNIINATLDSYVKDKVNIGKE